MQASVSWKELSVLLRLLHGAYLPSLCLEAEQTTFHCPLPQAAVEGQSGITEKHFCFWGNDLDEHNTVGKQGQWKQTPFLGAGAEQSLGSRAGGVWYWVLC